MGLVDKIEITSELSEVELLYGVAFAIYMINRYASQYLALNGEQKYEGNGSILLQTMVFFIKSKMWKGYTSYKKKQCFVSIVMITIINTASPLNRIQGNFPSQLIVYR